MKKLVTKSLVILLILQVVSPVFFNDVVLAESSIDKVDCSEDNPPVCTATPDDMAIYLEFQKEMATILSKNGFKTSTEIMSEGGAGLFTTKTLELTGLQAFNESLAWQAIRIFDITVTRSATAIITATFLFELSAVSALADNTLWLTILFQERPIVRDWVKLLDVERSLNTSAYDLWRAWEIAKTVVEMDKINDIVKKYEGKGLFKNNSNFWVSARYMDIVMELVELNAAVKWCLVYSDETPLNDFKSNDHHLDVSEDWSRKIRNAYICARPKYGLKCNTSWAALKKNLSILGNSTKKQGKGSVDQIKQSYRNLVESLWNWNAVKKDADLKSSLTKRELEILRSRYWLNASKITDKEGLHLLSLPSTIVAWWKKAKKGINMAVQNVKTWVKQTFYRKECLNKCLDSDKRNSTECVDYLKKNDRCNDVLEKKDVKAQREMNKGKEEKSKNSNVLFPGTFDASVNRYAGTELSQKLDKALDELVASQEDAERLAAISQNLDLTQSFIEYSKKIDELAEETIWDKDKGLRKALNDVCQEQCKNRDNSCCYVQ